MTKTTLILGASGKTGRRLAPLLEAWGFSTRKASRTATGHSHFDWYNAGTYRPALNGVSSVYLIAADPGADPAETVEPFLHEARLAGVEKVVAVSSLGVTFSGEPPHSPRRKFEQIVTDSGIDWTILRPSGFNQNFSEGFLAPGIGAGRVATATGSGKVGFVDAEDIAAVAAAALTEAGHEGQRYALTGPEAMTFEQAVAIIATAAERPIAYGALTVEQFADILQQAGVPPESAAIVVRDQLAIAGGEGALVSNAVHRVTGRPAGRFDDYASVAWGK